MKRILTVLGFTGALIALAGCDGQRRVAAQQMQSCVSRAGITGPYQVEVQQVQGHPTRTIKAGPNVSYRQATLANSCLERTSAAGSMSQAAPERPFWQMFRRSAQESESSGACSLEMVGGTSYVCRNSGWF